ncbi:MAG TPA: PAS domain S-box protein [Solirubrobacterales bacterium]|nr:PAS domain S-box protein [Solirubrobacterales bacterium]
MGIAAKQGGSGGERRTHVGRRREDLDREMLRLLVESAQDYAIFVIDLEGRVLTWNEGAERIFGYRADEIMGRRIDLFFIEADRVAGRRRRLLDLALQQGRVDVEGVRVRRDGTAFQASVVTTALRDESGSPRGFSKVIRDVTERRQAEEALERRAREVQELADQRARLVLELMSAEERERRRISQALHDDALQNLLAAKQDLIDARRNGERDVEAIGRAEESIGRTIEQLRDTALELHPLLLENEGLAVALDAVAKGAAALGGFRCSVRVETDASGVNDQVVLAIVRELLVNAAKHSDADRVSVVVERDDGQLVLDVVDDGKGMPATRYEAALSEGHLGLASIAQRLDALGGALEVSSAPGGGTAVSAALPVASEHRTG